MSSASQINAGVPEHIDATETAELIQQAMKKGAIEWAHTIAATYLRKNLVDDKSAAENLLLIEALYFLALKVMQHGNNANSLLQALGVKWTLSPVLLSLPRPHPPLPLMKEGHTERDVAYLSDVVPEEMLEQLQAGFSRESRFWQDHKYFDQDTPFHSYLIQPLKEDAISLLEQVAWSLYAHIREIFPRKASSIQCAEVWAHLRHPDSPHQLHVDTDEALLQTDGFQHQHMPHPVVSAVVFLQSCQCAGPTVIIKQKAGAPLGKTAWLAHPQEGAAVLYPGAYFHGVLPGRGITCSQHSDRTTLILAYWSCKKETHPLPGLGPCMAFPATRHASTVSHANNSFQSVIEYPAVDCSLGCGHSNASLHAMQKSGAWQAVNPTSKGHVCLKGPLPDLRFFLQNDDSLSRLY